VATIGPPADLLLTEIMTAIKAACDSARLNIKTRAARQLREGGLKYLKQDTPATALKHCSRPMGGDGDY